MLFEKSEYMWTVCKYSLRSDYEDWTKPGPHVSSPIFPEFGGKYKWKLELYPDGNLGALDHVSLNLRSAAEFRNKITVEFDFSLRNTKNYLIVRKEGTHIFENCLSYLACELIPCESLVPLIKEGDILKIHAVVFAEVSTLQPCPINCSDFNSIVKLSRDLEDMFTSGEFKDFAIKFKDKTEVSVHRNILAARSPVFAAMFKHDVSENKIGSTEINDVDKVTMMQLLTFVYTGNVKNISPEEAMNLLGAADKYQITDLTECCSNIIKCNITESNVLDILILAEVRRVSELKKTAYEYVLANPEKFSDQSCLEKLKKYPDLLIEFSSKMFNLLQVKPRN